MTSGVTGPQSSRDKGQNSWEKKIQSDTGQILVVTPSATVAEV